MKEFETAKNQFLSRGKSDLELGKKGSIEINYEEIEFGGAKTICLCVTNPKQNVYFGNSGGRIFDWVVDGKSVVSKRSATGGFCMDLLWLPVNSRWSGDQVQEMKLVKCTNNGKEATVVYTGEFKKGLPNLKIVKTYKIPATGSSIDFDIKLTNGTPLPVTVSYWNHNMLPFCNPVFFGISEGKLLKVDPKRNSIFCAEKLPDEFREFICMPKELIAPVKNKFAEYSPTEKLGMVITLPDNFLNIYRWNSKTKNSSGSEWMTQPIKIPAGSSSDINFSIRILTNTNPDTFKKLLE